MRIKNWKKFQHFKDRRPPWIKLHRDIMEKRDITVISDCSFRVLVLLWLLASEDEELVGNLPDVAEIAFRLRMPEKRIVKALQELRPWVEQDDISAISERYQAGPPETETEAEGEAEGESPAKTRCASSAGSPTFDVTEVFEMQFWPAYPARNGVRKEKQASLKAWKVQATSKHKAYQVLTAVKNYAEHCRRMDEFPKDACRWLANGKWTEWLYYVPPLVDDDFPGARRANGPFD